MSTLIPTPPTPEEFDAEVAAVFGWDDIEAVQGDPTPKAADPVPAVVPSAAEPEAGVPVAPVAPASDTTVVTAPATGSPAEVLPPLAPQAPVVATETEAEKNLRFASVEAQLAAATAELARVKQESASAPAPTQAVPSEEPEKVIYALTIPDEVLGAIFDEEPVKAKAGLEHLVNSLAGVIHNRVRAEYATRIQTLEETITARDQAVQLQTAEEQRSALQQQYFAKFPDHNKPVLQHILYAEAQKLAAEYPAAPADDNYFNALGTRVNAAIAELTGAVVPTPATPAVPAKPAAMMPTASRSAIPVASTLKTENEMSELFKDDFD